MRTLFVQQLTIGVEPISKVRIPDIVRDELPPVLRALQYIFVTPELNEKVFSILRQVFKNVDLNKGRNGMSGWEILVLAVIRNSLDTNYDRLCDFANHHELVKKIMGVYVYFGHDPIRQEYGLQTIKDNVKLLSEDLINQINALVVESGHSLVKKKEGQKLNINVDTYVLESNVHFPTDLNLLWDSIRKVIAISCSLSKDYNIDGWRKEKSWRRKLKGSFRISARVHKAGGQNKEIRLKTLVSAYLGLSKLLLDKTLETLDELSKIQATELSFFVRVQELESYKDMLVKHIDLVERRIINDETIPASEKLVSIFEKHAEWLQKGKSGRKSVEFGHNLLIASDQFQFIVYHKVIEGEADVSLTQETVDKLYEKFTGLLYSVSFDKGFSSKEAKSAITASGKVEVLILPKRGKLNKDEQEEEDSKEFKRLKNKHSRIESDINRLEHNGLNTCPDKGLPNFKRYAALGILSYNLHNLGKILISKELRSKEKERAKQRIKTEQKERSPIEQNFNLFI
jgi:hypothetical protein